ncbi:MAG TPA: ABC transporter permease subunit [Ilumatobacteraceae bacterium]|nr:ABC transporter permease subunit [Ilumatobacteraceae bacterium]
MSPSVRRIVAPLVGVVTFGLLWEAAVRVFDIRRFVLLAPSEILRELAEAPGFYWSNALVTGRHMLVGLSIAMAFALVVGALMASSRFIEEATQPVLILILVTPWVAYITSVVLWLDGGDPTILFMVAFTSFPVFTFGVVGGMKSTDPAARELLASVDARPWEVFWRLRLPASLPSIFTTLRFALGLGLAAAYFSEGSALTRDGLGAIGRTAAASNQAETLWATITSAALLGIAGLLVISLLERSLLRWHASQRS